MIFHNTKLINLGETEVSLFLFVLLVVFFPRREMQTTSRYASRTSASLGEGYSFIALRFGTCSRRVNQQVQNYKTYLKNSHFGVEKFNFSLGLSFNFFCMDIILLSV